MPRFVISHLGKYSLRLLTDKDSIEYFQLLDENRDRLRRYFPTSVKAVQTISDAKTYLLNQTNHGSDKREVYPFGIFLKGKLIGWISIKSIIWEEKLCELGYYLDKNYEGMGIMSNVVSDILDYAFEELKLVKVFLRIGRDNPGSARVALKNGFCLEKVLKKEFQIETGELVDLEYYTKTKSSPS